MIAQLQGKVSYSDPRYIVLNVNGVGYKVFVTSETNSSLSAKSEENVLLWTYLAVREDALVLFGFPTQRDLRFFELLITVSGIGPKTAMGILNVASVDVIENAIAANDTSHLVKIAGVGKKAADKIVLELKDKIDAVSGDHGDYMKNESDALEALKSLGYSHSESREALKQVDKTIADTGARVKAALKILGK